jgi:hypothetical protein
MGIWARLMALFGGPPLEAPPQRRLDASNEASLAASIKWLPPETRGWITTDEARALFSRMSREYAFGDLDARGRLNLASFAEQADHRCEVQFMPVEGRVYFRKLSSRA